MTKEMLWLRGELKVLGILVFLGLAIVSFAILHVGGQAERKVVVVEQELKYYEVDKIQQTVNPKAWLCTEGIKVNDFRNLDTKHVFFKGDGQCAVLFEKEQST